MKNLLVPAAIAIGGLFVVNHLKDAGQVTDIRQVASKHNPARHHKHFSNLEVTEAVSEVPANTVKIASFDSISETVMPTFFIDFSDAQTALSDLEISKQMEENLVEISLPDTNDADAEINENFTAK